MRYQLIKCQTCIDRHVQLALTCSRVALSLPSPNLPPPQISLAHLLQVAPVKCNYKVCIIGCLQYSHQCLLHAAAVAVAVVATNGYDAPTCKSYLRMYLHGARWRFVDRDPVKTASAAFSRQADHTLLALDCMSCHTCAHNLHLVASRKQNAAVVRTDF